MSMVENPIKRYAIKGGMAGLAYGGGTDRWRYQLQHTAPTQGQANWLPVPAGPFPPPCLRTYQPGSGNSRPNLSASASDDRVLTGFAGHHLNGVNLGDDRPFTLKRWNLSLRYPGNRWS